MSQTIKDILIGTFAGLLLSIFLFCGICEASTGMIGSNQDGNVYASDTGWLTIRGDTYYIHASKSMAYEVGEACRREYRWRGNKLYYFGADGKAIEHNTRFIKLNRDDSVKYIYFPGTRERYNANSQRWQIKEADGWQDLGQQTNVWWMCDWQW